MTLYSPLHESTLMVDGLAVRCYDSDPESRERPVVLLHGTGGSAEANFWSIFPMLAFTRRVIAFDFATPDPNVTIDDYRRQAAEVIARLAPAGPVDLVGYSLGAVVAASLAGRRPDLVASLVLVAGWMKTNRHQRLRNDVWQHLDSTRAEVAADFAVFCAYSSQHLLSRNPREYAQILSSARAARYDPRVMDLNRRIDVTDDVGNIVAPTLVVGCVHDQMVPIRHSHELFGAIADARFTAVDSGHAVVHERPAQLFVLIDEFVADPTATRSGSVLQPEHA